MKKLESMNISKRFFWVFRILILLMLISAGSAIISFQVIGSTMKTFYHVQYETTKNQMEIRKDVQTINKRLLWAVICQDAEVIKEQKEDFTSRFEKIDGYIAVIHKNLDSKNVSESLSKAFDDFKNDTNQMMNLVETGDTEGAITYYETTFNDVSETLADALDKTGNMADAAAEKEYRFSIVMRIATSILLVGIAIVSLVVAIRLAKRLTKSVVQPLQDIQMGTEKISQGNLQTQIVYHGEDEIGQVAESLRSSMGIISSYITEIDEVMRKMADANFDIVFQSEFIGDFKSIQESINYFSSHISADMTSINQVSQQVSSGSMQIADGAQSLAEGATEQAGIAEELSASVSNISQRITENAKNATEISKEVGQVTKGITYGNEKMKAVTEAMDSINSTSQEIRNIIDTINNIAEQTNLLALNASIEAARAGEAGRGFAVVADQVSMLASQSAQAANNSNQLIETSLHAVEEGKKVADGTANIMNQVADYANLISKKVDGIAVASNEQAEAIKQVDIGIEQIAHVVETNAATAEESSASSEELANEAQALRDLVSKFTIKQA